MIKQKLFRNEISNIEILLNSIDKTNDPNILLDLISIIEEIENFQKLQYKDLKKLIALKVYS